MGPGNGERRAITGYVNQYRVAAMQILIALPEIESIRVCDPAAGTVDDVQVQRHGRIDGFQVKWSAYPGPFTFRNLTTPLEGKPCLIRQLAEGWELLQRKYPGKRIAVHLITNDIPSKNDELPAGETKPTPRHFAAFLAQAWHLQHSASDTAIPECWQGAWLGLQEASELAQDRFGRFVRDCYLEFNYRLPDPTESGFENRQRLDDIEHVVQTLFQAVADPRRIVELNRKQLLTSLGWANRYEYFNLHDFPSPTLPYIANSDATTSLDRALSSLNGGYIMVLGTPGIGKSTFLTQYFRTSSYRVIRYYAYVPDEPYSRSWRGESANFFHDVTLRLEQLGFRVGSVANRTSPGDDREKLHEQMRLLSEDAQTNGIKTVILVDGLDHITREQHPNRSLLDDLPSPDQVPDGVFFVLGSQTDVVLSSRIQSVVADEARRIEMSGLSRSTVRHLCQAVQLPFWLSDEQVEQAFDHTGGHPLALVYVFERIRELKTASELATVFAGSSPYASVVQDYQAYWDSLPRESNTQHALGLLARIRGPIDLNWVRLWIHAGALDTAIEALRRYFIREGSRWYFFHNSFRRFLIEKSACDRMGQRDAQRERAFFAELARGCETAETGSVRKWDELYYLHEAGDHRAVLGLAQPDLFIQQLLEFRPVEAIQSDLAVAFESAAKEKDVVAITRLLLIACEMRSRADHLAETSLTRMLIDLGEVEKAVLHIREGRMLRVSQSEGLELAATLLKHSPEESKRIFELSEPLHMLGNSVRIEEFDTDRQLEPLLSWARTAPWFLDLSGIVTRIRDTKVTISRRGNDEWEDASATIQRAMLAAVAGTLIQKRQWTAIESALEELHTDDALDLEVWRQSIRDAARERYTLGDKAGAEQYVRRLLSRVDAVTLPAAERVETAECVYRILADLPLARRLMEGLNQPPPLSPRDWYNAGIGIFMERLQYNRMLAVLNEAAPPIEAVPDAKRPEDNPVVAMERAVCRIARIWGSHWLNERVSDQTIKSEALSILRSFSRPDYHAPEEHTWHALTHARREALELLVRASSLHGRAALSSLVSLLSEEWKGEETRQNWSPNGRRALVLALSHEHWDAAWVCTELESIASAFEPSATDTADQIQNFREQAEGWLELDNREAAQRCLHRMLQGAAGVGYRKDYQVDSWVSWLSRMNELEPAHSPERICRMLAILVRMDAMCEGRAVSSAARQLLRIAFEWSPRRAVILFQWMLSHGMIAYCDTVGLLCSWAMEREPSAVKMGRHVLSLILNPLEISPSKEREPVVDAMVSAALKLGESYLNRTFDEYDHSIKRYVLPSRRKTMHFGVRAAASELGVASFTAVADTGLAAERENAQPPLLKLRDGRELTYTQVAEATVDYASLKLLLDSEAEYCNFDWVVLLGVIEPRLTCEDLFDLALRFCNRHNSAKVLCELGRLLKERGESSKAKEVVLFALENSHAYGWGDYYDGGTRLLAMDTLFAIDSAFARKKALEILLADFNESKYPLSIAENLHRILPLLTEAVPHAAVWSEIDSYLGRLFPDIESDVELLKMLSAAPGLDTPDRALAELLFIQTVHPASFVRERAIRSAVASLLDDSEPMKAVLADAQLANDDKQEAAAVIIDAATVAKPPLASEFSTTLQSLASSGNARVRLTVGEICARSSLPVAQHERRMRPMPAIYKLAMPDPIDEPDEEPDSRLGGVRSLADSESIEKLIRPFHNDLSTLAEVTGINRTSLVYRTHQLMCKLVPPNEWSEEAERRYRRTSDIAGLRLGFTRPRAWVARRAVAHLFAELVDVGRLKPAIATQLTFLIRFHDPYLYTAQESVRPEWIKQATALQNTYSVRDDWLASVDEALQLLGTETNDGRVIIAEETTLRRFVSDDPVEIRRSYLCAADGDIDSCCYAECSQWTVADYAKPSYLQDSERIIVKNRGTRFENPGRFWIALNPFLARHLGWKLAGDRGFAWEDDGGRTMVESLWWVDGPQEVSGHPVGADEVGEGWCVVASSEAVAVILGAVPNARFHQFVRREKSGGDKPESISQCERQSTIRS